MPRLRCFKAPQYLGPSRCICKLLLLSCLRELTYRDCAHAFRWYAWLVIGWPGYLYKCFRCIIHSEIYISAVRLWENIYPPSLFLDDYFKEERRIWFTGTASFNLRYGTLEKMMGVYVSFFFIHDRENKSPMLECHFVFFFFNNIS